MCAGIADGAGAAVLLVNGAGATVLLADPAAAGQEQPSYLWEISKRLKDKEEKDYENSTSYNGNIPDNTFGAC